MNVAKGCMKVLKFVRIHETSKNDNTALSILCLFIFQELSNGKLAMQFHYILLLCGMAIFFTLNFPHPNIYPLIYLTVTTFVLRILDT